MGKSFASSVDEAKYTFFSDDLPQADAIRWELGKDRGLASWWKLRVYVGLRRGLLEGQVRIMMQGLYRVFET